MSGVVLCPFLSYFELIGDNFVRGHPARFVASIAFGVATMALFAVLAPTEAFKWVSTRRFRLPNGINIARQWVEFTAALVALMIAFKIAKAAGSETMSALVGGVSSGLPSASLLGGKVRAARRQRVGG